FSPKPVDYEANPVTAYDRIVKGGGGGGSLTPTGGGAPASGPTAPAGFDNEVLDLVDAEIGELAGRLAATPNERRKLDQHRLSLKGLRVAAPSSGTAPSPMTAPPLPGMDKCGLGPLPSVEKLRPALQGNARAAYQSQYYS